MRCGSIATKWGPTADPVTRLPAGIDGSETNARRAVENSLRYLRTDHIDLYYLHRKDPARPIEESVEAMAKPPALKAPKSRPARRMPSGRDRPSSATVMASKPMKEKQTTVAPVSTAVPLITRDWEFLNGFIWVPTPQERPVLTISQGAALRLITAPSASMTVSGFMIVEELL